MLFSPRSLAIALLVSTVVPQAQTPSVRVTRTVTISSDAPKLPHAESYFAINPVNSLDMLAVSLVMRSDRKIGSTAYVSHDGGQRWTPIVLPAESKTLLEGGDPIAYFDGKGVAYFATNTGQGLKI